MRESGQYVWWRKTGQLAAGLVGGLALLALLPAVLAAALSGRTFLGMPLAFFLFAVAAPLATLIAIFWFARKQQALDRRYDVTGNQA